MEISLGSGSIMYRLIRKDFEQPYYEKKQEIYIFPKNYVITNEEESYYEDA